MNLRNRRHYLDLYIISRDFPISHRPKPPKPPKPRLALLLSLLVEVADQIATRFKLPPPTVDATLFLQLHLPKHTPYGTGRLVYHTVALTMIQTTLTALFLSLLSVGNAFAPSSTSTSTSSSRGSALGSTKADLESLAVAANPTVKFFDPLQLADQDFWGLGNEATIGWLRQSEIKHGRIAMAAFVGYLVQSNFVFPWPETLSGAMHPSADLTPEAQWDAIPEGAKWQIIGLVGFLEVWDELGGGGALTHYTKGRQPGKYPSFKNFSAKIHPVLDLYDPFGRNEKMADDVKERRLVSELNNGRAAMLGLFGFLCADKIPGSVPLLDALGAAKSYSGNPMAPFEGNFDSLFGWLH